MVANLTASAPLQQVQVDDAAAPGFRDRGGVQADHMFG